MGSQCQISTESGRLKRAQYHPKAASQKGSRRPESLKDGGQPARLNLPAVLRSVKVRAMNWKEGNKRGQNVNLEVKNLLPK